MACRVEELCIELLELVEDQILYAGHYAPD